jgi:hypothetical protein
MKLYEISQKLLEIEQRLAETESTQEERVAALHEALADWNDAFESKVQSIAGLVETLAVEAEAQKAIIKRRQQSVKSIEARIASITSYCIQMMKMSDNLTIKSAEMSVRVKFGPGHVEIDDEAKIEGDYKLFVPSAWAIDKVAMLAALRAKKSAGEAAVIPGAHLGISEKLEIK